MGIYLNPGNKNFSDMTRARIFVDKTMMIPVTNRFIDEDNRYICVSRPRRFGKTIAGNMLAAYYSKGCDSHELFSGFKVSKDPSFEEKLNKYNVIKEMTTGKGFADVVFIPFTADIPAMVIELKRNGSVENALDQIKEKIVLTYEACTRPCGVV